MTPRQTRKDQDTLKEKIKKERIEKNKYRLQKEGKLKKKKRK